MVELTEGDPRLWTLTTGTEVKADPVGIGPSIYLPHSASSNDLFLTHTSGKLYGPYELKAGTLIGIGSGQYEIVAYEANAFTLKQTRTQQVYGPFACNEGETIALAGASYTVGINNHSPSLAQIKQWCVDVVELRKAFMSNDADAHMGFVYFVGNGRGVEQNLPEALVHLVPAAQRGQPDAQFLLGVVYETGSGVKRNIAKAREWIEKAARQGQSQAKAWLASDNQIRAEAQQREAQQRQRANPAIRAEAQQQPQTYQANREEQILNYISTSYPTFVGLYRTVQEASSVARQKNAMQEGSVNAQRELLQNSGGGEYVGNVRYGKHVFRYDQALNGFVVYQK